MTTSNPFLPENYTPPTSESNYLKPDKGKIKFRFLSSPIIGWRYWTINEENKKIPHCVKTLQELPRLNEKPQHFWAAIVYDYEAKLIKILTITQKTIQAMIKAYCDDDSWGNPKDYDLSINGVGDGMEREYSVIPSPKKPLDESILEEAKKINLEALYDGGDPFEGLKK